ncbi:prepilin-type N-terminal cleavage/methylation domain-containing protein [Photobacterium kishitanii]|uniref:Prepilin-type N-terminal cleavage/methylation domain-containing protein n=2 Tax=Photobacterium kishitanii TaxID=318456 RepID=A0AAX0Z072_9GAMM|nr:prepilin-type N-terminal cleavage/methylation domain-containing protein [Photobacterium kishitanii]PSX30461.1 prepilin-type N-terminal cleavage/methylation domain-containing protein [Photobacterium kishitanii]PSX35891.1 prepilin-type N-terminal cleavage/methylation domain-containing protein [Photobacterium kishitanii]PSX45526.1 prepilin-type N-terminal cleavage/methylation domain-containing protein [Photobacterium kishitanii]
MYKKQRGMTLLEIIIVLGIMGVISAGVVILAQRAIDNQNTTKLVQALNTVQTALVQTYRSKGTYPIITDAAETKKLTDALVSMGKVSKDDLTNPLSGGLFEIKTVKDQGVANKGFLIKIDTLTKDQCVALVTSTTDMFRYVEVVTSGTAPKDDLSTIADASAGMGVIKSANPTSTNFDSADLDHVSALCGNGTASLDVFVGNR